MTLYELLRQRYSEKEIEEQMKNAVVTSTAIEGVEIDIDDL